MPTPQAYSFQRYLSAKKSVDDRALNHQVQAALLERLGRFEKPLRVLEIGAGIGTMLERLLAWGLPDQLDYTGIDAQPENIAAAWERLTRWADINAYQFTGSTLGEPVELKRGNQRLRVRFEASDLLEFADRSQGQQPWDLQIAHAFLDLMDIPATLPRLFEMIRAEGLFYYTINFDGVTSFEPSIDPEFDARVEHLYHRTMDERMTDGRPSGDSQAGRHLFGYLQAAGAALLAAGPSDWVVFPQAGRYQHDEAYFLHFIIHTLHTALVGHPELDQIKFDRWIAQRHNQIERGELIYIAHQLDFLGQSPVAHQPAEPIE